MQEEVISEGKSTPGRGNSKGKDSEARALWTVHKVARGSVDTAERVRRNRVSKIQKHRSCGGDGGWGGRQHG